MPRKSGLSQLSIHTSPSVYLSGYIFKRIWDVMMSKCWNKVLLNEGNEPTRPWLLTGTLRHKSVNLSIKNEVFHSKVPHEIMA